MLSIKNLLLLPLAFVLLTGCAHNTVTNLTPSVQPRNAKNLYPIELIFDSNMHAMRDASVRAYVVVGFDAYEMKPTLGMSNRWEAMVPVPKDKDSVGYHFKVDYQYNRIGQPAGDGSKLSRNYILRIVEE